MGAPKFWETTRVMVSSLGRVLVTGGAGFIGSHLVERLLREGAEEVVIVDNLYSGRPENLDPYRSNPRVDILDVDIRDPEALSEAIRDASVIYHLAAQSNLIDSVVDVDYCFSTNVVGTYNVLRAASRYAVRRVIFSSSHEVYGEPTRAILCFLSTRTAPASWLGRRIAGHSVTPLDCRLWSSVSRMSMGSGTQVG